MKLMLLLFIVLLLFGCTDPWIVERERCEGGKYYLEVCKRSDKSICEVKEVSLETYLQYKYGDEYP